MTGPLSFEKNDFSGLLRESIHSGIRNVLGEDVLQAVRRLLRLEECAERPDEFHQRLSPVFGDWGAKTLEKMIVRDLFQRLNFSMADGTPFDFERYVNQARVRLSNEKKGSTEHG